MITPTNQIFEKPHILEKVGDLFLKRLKNHNWLNKFNLTKITRRLAETKPKNKTEFISSTGAVKTLGGSWICLEELGRSEVSVYSLNYFVEGELRTGIALSGRNVRTGHLYTFRHFRLNAGVELVFGINNDLPIKESGTLKLGAEQRFGEYAKIEPLNIPTFSTGQFMTLSLVEGNQETNDMVQTSGKIIYLGGWDLKKGFHKPMKGYYPAGTIFSKKINSNCIEI